MSRRDEEEGIISGGRFVPAANTLLPGTRSYRIQSGRYVPAAETILPPEMSMVSMDWENAYHFGSRIGSGISVSPPNQLTVMPGDTVRVTFTISHLGPTATYQVRAAFGLHQAGIFNEDGNKTVQTSVLFPQHTVLTTWSFALNIPISGNLGIKDFYAKIIGTPEGDIFTVGDAGEVYTAILNVVSAAGFSNFMVTDYSKV